MASVNSSTSPVDRDLVEPRHARSRRARGSPAGSRRRQQQAERAAAERQQDALGQQLADDAAAAGAERRADGDLPLPRQRPRQQQVGDVGARDQQHEGRPTPSRTSSDEPHVADHLLLQRHDAERQAAVRRIEVRDARGAAAR